MGGAGGVLEGGEAGSGSRVEPMSVELEALKEKVRVLERDGAAPSKFICLVCQVGVRGRSWELSLVCVDSCLSVCRGSHSICLFSHAFSLSSVSFLRQKGINLICFYLTCW